MQSVFDIPSLYSLVGAIIVALVAQNVEASPIYNRCAPCDYPCISLTDVRTPLDCPVCQCPPPDFPWNTVEETLSQAQFRANAQASGISTDVDQTVESVESLESAEPFESREVSSSVSSDNSIEDDLLPPPDNACRLPFGFQSPSMSEIVFSGGSPVVPSSLDFAFGNLKSPFSDCPESDPCPGQCPIGVDENGCQICGCGAEFFSNQKPEKKSDHLSSISVF